MKRILININRPQKIRVATIYKDNLINFDPDFCTKYTEKKI